MPPSDYILINSLNCSSKDVHNLAKSIIVFLIKNIARKLDIAFGDDCRKHHYVFNPQVMLL